MPKLIQWRVYYDDGSVFDNEMGSWEDAPLEGVQCVAARDDVYGRRVHHFVDYYMWPPHIDHPLSTHDLGPTLRGLRWIKFGRYVRTSQAKENQHCCQQLQLKQQCNLCLAIELVHHVLLNFHRQIHFGFPVPLPQKRMLLLYR